MAFKVLCRGVLRAFRQVALAAADHGNNALWLAPRLLQNYVVVVFDSGASYGRLALYARANNTLIL